MKIIINGIYGRMGRMILETATEFPFADVICGFDSAEPPAEPVTFKGKEIPVYKCPDDFIGSADVIIDFSHFSAVPSLLFYAAEKKIPVVICTTALEDEAKTAMKKAAAEIAVFNSANMSLGINVMKKMAQCAMPAFEDNFNVEIVEKHHNQKLDSPSGTALMLADAINEACDTDKKYIYGRHGKDDSVKITDMGIHSVRGGTLPGEHTILFAGKDEVLEITHRVFSRKVFAVGALSAAVFISDKNPGMYSMEDLVEGKEE